MRFSTSFYAKGENTYRLNLWLKIFYIWIKNKGEGGGYYIRFGDIFYSKGELLYTLKI